MRIGFIGLGKLGLPTALAIEEAGHEVAGWDTSESVRAIIEDGWLPYQEERADRLLMASELRLMIPERIREWAELIFVAVQTPHDPEYEGVTPLPRSRDDFDYSYLCDALKSVDEARAPVVVVSTVLPGTLGSLGATHVLYNPSFIAMGTTIPDFKNPEFVLIGSDGTPTTSLREFYDTIHSRPIFVTDIKTAELTKMAYNTFIGLKIAFANTMMEICERIGADVDDVIDALSLAHRRLLSSAYMRGGMGDGGGCHPRDNIALSWLARELGLSYDLFGAMMECREAQSAWLADLVEESEGPVALHGKAYKPDTNLTVGSPARLLAWQLDDRGVAYTHDDPYDEEE